MLLFSSCSWLLSIMGSLNSHSRYLNRLHFLYMFTWECCFKTIKPIYFLNAFAIKSNWMKKIKTKTLNKSVEKNTFNKQFGVTSRNSRKTTITNFKNLTSDRHLKNQRSFSLPLHTFVIVRLHEASYFVKKSFNT